MNVKVGILTVAIAATTLMACKKEGCTDPNAENYSEKAKKDDGSCTYAVSSNTVVSGTINANTTWTADKIYELSGKVVVGNGVTLTIQAGTIIKAQEGTDVNASALIVQRDANIMAEGTASNPIIFTSILDNITVGQDAGTNLSAQDAGKWGGVIVLGNAPVSTANGDTEGQIEGIPATDAFGTYGGSDAADNSGVLKYISIRHSGALIGAGNEINGLTLGGVGSGTIVENIEIVGNLDDGVEIFGGTVNVKNVLVAYQQDDAIDVDQNWAGTLDNFYTLQAATGSDEAMEIDGPEGSTHTTGLFTIKNGTCMVDNGTYSNGDFKSKAQGTVMNVVFGNAKIRASFDEANACADKSDAYSYLVATTPKLIFTDAKFSGVVVYTDATTCTIPSDFQANAESKMTSNNSATGANATVFSWTYAAKKGLL